MACDLHENIRVGCINYYLCMFSNESNCGNECSNCGNSCSNSYCTVMPPILPGSTNIFITTRKASARPRDSQQPTLSDLITGVGVHGLVTFPLICATSSHDPPSSLNLTTIPSDPSSSPSPSPSCHASSQIRCFSQIRRTTGRTSWSLRGHLVTKMIE